MVRAISAKRLSPTIKLLLSPRTACARQGSEHLILGDLTCPIEHEHPGRRAGKHRVTALACERRNDAGIEGHRANMVRALNCPILNS
jgi:hypothetical protein